MIFPDDFEVTPHKVIKGAKQWLPKTPLECFFSVVGGKEGLYGDGIKSFEVMVGRKVYAYQNHDEVNELIEKVIDLMED